MIGSENLISLIKEFEGFSPKPYLCPSKIPTIGFGNTFYENGAKVTMNDTPITEHRAVELLKNTLKGFETGVTSIVKRTITQNQFDALVDFAYNCGLNNLKISTLLRKVNINPNDPSIKDEFAKWNKSNGKVLQGLVRRREKEAELYFKK